MVQKHRNWIEENKTVIGWLFAALIYGAGLYGAIQQRVQASDTKNDVQEEKILQNTRDIRDLKTTLKDIDSAIKRIDNNVIEIKTEVKYKKDK